ncbi:MAG: glycosyltransferase [Bacteroidia bacterium]
MEIIHIVITKFNLAPINAKNSDPKPYLGSWLTSRCNLFEQFCLPTVKAQSVQSFKWLLLFEHTTPNSIISKYADGNIVPIAVDSTQFKKRSEIVKHYVAKQIEGNKGKILITTRLDNDDMLNSNYFELLQQWVKHNYYEKPTILQFTKGSQFNTSTQKWQRISTKKAYCNPFISLVETIGHNPIYTVNHIGHVRMRNHFEIKNLKHKNAWCQIIHNNNIANEWKTGLKIQRSLSNLRPEGFEFKG